MRPVSPAACVRPTADADGIAGHAGMADEHEDIRVRVWPADRAIEAALAGAFTNSVTMIGLLWLAAQRDCAAARNGRTA